MTGIFLHQYDASPFSQKAIKMLAIKQLDWRSVEMPMIKPKPELVRLTGGYQGTPVLQLGAHLYVDTMRIAQALEELAPHPSLFPNGNRGMPLALAFWGDGFFEAGLHLAISAYAGQWDAAFAADRQAVFARLDFAEVAADVAQAAASLRAHAALIDGQLADGRAFLQGSAPGLADIHAWAVPWFVRPSIAGSSDLLSAFSHLPAWEARMAGLGEGGRQAGSYPQAEAAAQAGQAGIAPGWAGEHTIDPDDPLGLVAGQQVQVSSTQSDRGGSTGQLEKLDAREVVIRQQAADGPVTLVHFPRLSYRIDAV